MHDWASDLTAMLWPSAIILAPLALLVAATCRMVPSRPATRHAMWFMVLVLFLAPAVFPRSWSPDYSRVTREAAQPIADVATPVAMHHAETLGSMDAMRALEPAPCVESLDRESGMSQGTEAPAISDEAVTPTPHAENSPPTPRSIRPHADDFPSDALCSASDTNLTPPWAVDRPDARTPIRFAPADGSGGPPSPLTDPAADITTSRETRQAAKGDAGAVDPPVASVAESPTGADTAERQIAFEAPGDAATGGLDRHTRTSNTGSGHPMEGPIAEAAPAGIEPDFGADRDIAAGLNVIAQAHARRDAGATAMQPSVQAAGQTERSWFGRALTSISAIPSQLIARWWPWAAGVRDAVYTMPPIPPGVWLTSMLAIIALHLTQRLRLRWTLRHATTAPASVRRMVAQIAREYGLRAPPRVLMINACISPMIWCGRRARLVLPTPLWNELDRAGRRAIICHEIAHLRRRDHWIGWWSLMVSCLYWWHPVVWWVQRRMNEEAELSCDAWVTALMPEGRRDYALALLATKEYVSRSGRGVPVGGLGVISGRTARFARRLTMVMTSRSRPGLSASGVCLVAALALVMWLTAPVWACPPEKQDKVQSKPARIEVVEPAATDGPGEVELIYHDESGDSAIIADGRTIVVGDPASGRVRAPDVRRAAEAAAAGQYNRAVQAYRAARADEGHGHGGEDVDERLDRLERRMAEILAHLERRSERTPAAIAVPGGRGLPASVPDAPSTLHRFGPTAGARSGGIAPGVFGSSAGGDIVRLYAIPKAKLAALAELMVRPDVPVRVRVLDNGIEVHGSQLDHQIFKAFVTMIIDSDKTKKRYKISPEKLEILGKLMVRPDVQLRVSVGSDRIEVFGTEAEHHAFKAFIDIIEGRQPETEGIPAISAAPGAPGPYTAPLMYATPLDVELQTTRPIVQTQSVLMSHNAAKQLALLAESNSEFAEQAVDLRSELADLNAELADLDAEMADASTEITRVQGELDRIHSEMEADGLDADERDELRTEFHELNSELVELASHIDDVRTNQVRIGNQRTMLEMQLRNVKSRLESIREQMAIAQDQAVIGSAPTASR